MGKNTPIVRDEGDRARVLFKPSEDSETEFNSGLLVGSVDWMKTLELGGLTRFRFEPKDERLPSYLARSEVRPGDNRFWYAYKQTESGLKKKYIGHSRALTYDKLLAIAFDYAGLVALPVTHELDDLLRPDEFKAEAEDTRDLWQKLDELQAKLARLEKENSNLAYARDRLFNDLNLAQQEILSRKKLHEMYKHTRMDALVKIEQVITQWNESAKDKRSKYDRSWGQALNLLRE